MAKTRRDVLREIYHFVEDRHLETGEPVVLQTIIDNFAKRYSTSPTTIMRYLDELVNSRNPFRLRTWYDKNRYYGVPTISRRTRACIVLTIAIPSVALIADICLAVPTTVLDKAILLLAGFWISAAVNRPKKEGRRTTQNQKD